MRHLAVTLKKHLPEDYKEAINVLLKLVDYLKHNQEVMSFGYMFLPDFIEEYGLEDYETSVRAMEELTQFTSCEFAVRPFILRYPKQMMAQMVGTSTRLGSPLRFRRLQAKAALGDGASCF